LFRQPVATWEIGQAHLAGDDHVLRLPGQQLGHRVVAHGTLQAHHGIGSGE
jgi:hypothetical protein